MRFHPVLASLMLALLPITAQAEGRSIIVLDASGSMWGQIDGRAKLEIARDALASVLAGVDPASELGPMAYGHRQKGALPAFNLAPHLFHAAGGAEVPTDLGTAWEVHAIAADGSMGDRISTEYDAPENTLRPEPYPILTRLDEA